MAGPRRILFASDFSKASAKAFATALALAKASGADTSSNHTWAGCRVIVHSRTRRLLHRRLLEETEVDERLR